MGSHTGYPSGPLGPIPPGAPSGPLIPCTGGQRSRRLVQVHFMVLSCLFFQENVVAERAGKVENLTGAPPDPGTPGKF